MGDLISQAEIDALLGGFSSAPKDEVVDLLTPEQKDILGEVGNISMGTAATTLSALLNQKVWITTPKVKTISLKQVADGYSRPCVGIRVDYKEGVRGSNILVIKQGDVKIISNLMMGGDGNIDPEEPLSELDMSAIAEAMNQMVGSSSTSLSSLIKRKIDIDTPNAFILDFTNDTYFDNIGFGENGIVAIQFRMEIGTLIDSEIMQILPQDFAGDMVEMMKEGMMGGPSPEPKPAPTPVHTPAPAPTQMPSQPQPQMQPQYQMPQQPQYQMPQQQMYQQPMPQYQQPDMNMYYNNYMPPPQPQPQPQPIPQQNVNVQPVQFQSFDVAEVMQQKENIGIIMDVPLDVTVELGRTNKKIKEILEFSPGTIIELEKLAGESIDILVNGKFVAKGEVVVIGENFGVRLTDIISVENRI